MAVTEGVFGKMIKTILSDDEGNRYLIFGLSKMNCDRLLDGQPIAFDPVELGPAFSDITKVVILGGNTPADIAREIADVFEVVVPEIPEGLE